MSSILEKNIILAITIRINNGLIEDMLKKQTKWNFILPYSQ